jgi:dolichol-phosphate mannosyltransferase
VIADPTSRAGSQPLVSIVIPVYNEGDAVIKVLRRIVDAVASPFEIIVVFDTVEDTTVPALEEFAERDARVKPTLNTYGHGPANAIRYGIDSAAAPVVVVTMADGSDDPTQIDVLTQLVERGVVVAAASRYMPGGQQVGGPWFKRRLSQFAGRSLYAFARTGTHDPTNSYKAYATYFVRAVGIDSRDGFELGLELTAKARRLRLPVAEIPTIWLDRELGTSTFRLYQWIPRYLRWYRFAFGRRLTWDDFASSNAPTAIDAHR